MFFKKNNIPSAKIYLFCNGRADILPINFYVDKEDLLKKILKTDNTLTFNNRV